MYRAVPSSKPSPVWSASGAKTHYESPSICNLIIKVPDSFSKGQNFQTAFNGLLELIRVSWFYNGSRMRLDQLLDQPACPHRWLRMPIGYWCNAWSTLDALPVYPRPSLADGWVRDRNSPPSSKQECDGLIWWSSSNGRTLLGGTRLSSSPPSSAKHSLWRFEKAQIALETNHFSFQV